MDAAGYHGSLFTLLNPYGLLTGILFVALFVLHGAVYVSLKTTGDLSVRASALAARSWTALLVVAVLFLVYTAFATKLIVNYMGTPILFIVPVLPWRRSCSSGSSQQGAGPRRPSPPRADHPPGERHGHHRSVPEPHPLEPGPSLQHDGLQLLVLFDDALAIMTVVALVFVPIVIPYKTVQGVLGQDLRSRRPRKRPTDDKPPVPGHRPGTGGQKTISLLQGLHHALEPAQVGVRLAALWGPRSRSRRTPAPG